MKTENSSFIIHHSSFSLSSFTLVELIVVMVVILILVGITLPVAKYVTKRANETKNTMAREKIVNALESYRGAFGEYPIPGDPRHYSTCYVTDTNNPPYSPITNVDLCTSDPTTIVLDWGPQITVSPPTSGVEHLPYDSLPYPKCYVNYRLTYPLMLGPLERNEAPFVEFPEITVCYLVYQKQTIGTVQETIRLKSTGTLKTITRYKTLKGNAINRVRAVSPLGYQWWYESDGVTYTLSPTNKWKM